MSTVPLRSQLLHSKHENLLHAMITRMKAIDLKPFYVKAAAAIVKTLYRVSYHDMHHIPETGGAILICNHVSYMDGMVINAGVNRPVRYIIDEDIYNVPGVHYFMSLNNAVPIAPRRDSVEKAIAIIAEGLNNGDVFCIFPEGQLTYTGNLSRFRLGIEWMLKAAPVPIIPMALSGLWGSILSRKDRGKLYRFIPRSFRRRVTLRCGAPMDGTTTSVSRMQHAIMHLMNQ